MNLIQFNDVLDITDLVQVKKFFKDGWFLIDTYKLKSSNGETLHFILAKTLMDEILLAEINRLKNA